MNLLLHKKQRMLLKQNDANLYEVGHVLGNLQQTLVDISANHLWHLPGIRLEQHLINWCKGCLGFVTLGGEGTLYLAGITVWNCHFYMEPQAFIRLNKMFFDTLLTWKSDFSTPFRTIKVEDSNLQIHSSQKHLLLFQKIFVPTLNMWDNFLGKWSNLTCFQGGQSVSFRRSEVEDAPETALLAVPETAAGPAT